VVWVGALLGSSFLSGRALAQSGVPEAQAGQQTARAAEAPPQGNPELPPEDDQPRYQEPLREEGAAERESPSQRVSITFSPLHLIAPIFELEAELMVVPHFGVGVIGGIGSIEADSGDPEIGKERFKAYELGLQVTGYPLKDFESLQLGAELLWVNVSSENIDGQDIQGEGSGIAVGPFIGYKLMTDVGFTLFVQGGAQLMTVTAEATDAEGNTDTADDSEVILLLNANIGWSF
jgi:hypothetical protein